MKIFNNIVFQSVFKIYYSSLLNFLRRDHNNVRMRHLVYILYIYAAGKDMTEVEGGRDVLAFKPNLMVERFRVRG